MGLAESIETSITNLLHSAPDLFWCKSVTITQDVLVFAGAIDKDGLAVQVEAVIAIFTQYWPRNISDAKRRSYLVKGNEGRFGVDVTILVVWSLQHRRESIEIWIVKTPAVSVGDGRNLSYLACLSRFES